MNEKKNLSVKTEESVVVVEVVVSCQGESVNQVAGAGELEFSTKTREVPLEKLERSEEKSRLENPESVSLETVCVAANLGVQLSVLCRYLSKAGGKRPTPGDGAAIIVDEADEYVEVVGSSTPAHGGADCERFTFRGSVSYAFLKNLGGFPDTSGIPWLKFLFNLIFTLL